MASNKKENASANYIDTSLTYFTHGGWGTSHSACSFVGYGPSPHLWNTADTVSMGIGILSIYCSLKLEETTAALQRTAAELELEKDKTDTLLYEMLPHKVVRQLREGLKVEAGGWRFSTLKLQCQWHAAL